MTVLITRPIEDSKLLAKRLGQENIRSFIEPMFHVKHLDIDINSLSYNNARGSIFTSRHAVMKIPQLLDLPCFVVGESTAKIAKECGFTNIITANGDLKSLINIIESKNKLGGGIFFYFRGQKITLDLTEFFQHKNIVVSSVVVYKTEEIETLSQELVDKILVNDIKTAIFSSENTVTIFMKKLAAYSLLDSSKKIWFLAISDKVCKSLQEAGFSKIKVYHNDTDQLVRLIKDNI